MTTTQSKIRVTDAAEVLGVSVDTIRRWEKKGLVRASRDNCNHRIFSLDELERVKNKYLGLTPDRDFYTLPKKRTTKYKAIELFSGAGGLALGLTRAGFRTELALEIDKDACATLKLNNKTHKLSWKKIVNDDIRSIDSFEEYQDKIDLVAGGFPCQAFSYAGLSRGFEDTRGTLFFEFARCVKDVQPKIVLGENVRGLLRHDKGKTLDTMVNTLDELGYNVEHRLLRAQFFDVPQKRERLLIIGIRKDLNEQIPFLFPKERDYTISMREALKNCPKSEGAKYPSKKYDVLKIVPPGGYWRDLPDRIQKEYMGASYHLGGGKTGMARRLSWDEPSLTLTCSPAQKQTERCHPDETRPLTIREYARIQSFPDDWKFTGSVASQYKQIGNAVPVNMAYHIGEQLIMMLKSNT